MLFMSLSEPKCKPRTSPKTTFKPWMLKQVFLQLLHQFLMGENYHIWAIRMRTYLEAIDLLEEVEEDYEIPPLPNNPTLAQIKNHRERKTRKSKAKAYLFAVVSPKIFTRIMSLDSGNAIWNYLREEYQGDERIRGMQMLNLIREFEMQKD